MIIFTKVNSHANDHIELCKKLNLKFKKKDAKGNFALISNWIKDIYITMDNIINYSPKVNPVNLKANLEARGIVVE